MALDNSGDIVLAAILTALPGMTTRELYRVAHRVEMLMRERPDAKVVAAEELKAALSAYAEKEPTQ